MTIFERKLKYGKGSNWVVEFNGMDGKRISKTFPGSLDKSEVMRLAKEEESQHIKDFNAGIFGHKKIGFKESADMYLQKRCTKKRMAPNTIRRSNVIVKKFIKYFGANRYITSIRKKDVEEYGEKREKDGADTSTINIELATLRTMYNKWIGWKLCSKNPVKGDDIFYDKKPKKQRFADENETQGLRVAIYSKSCSLTGRGLVLLGLNAGLRREEALGLQWEKSKEEKKKNKKVNYVNFERNILVIEKQKNKDYSELPLGLELKRCLVSLPKDSKFVISHDGQKYNDPRCLLRKIFKLAGLESFSYHNLRDTYITNLFNTMKIKLKVIMKLARHKSAEQTLAYDHTTDMDVKFGIVDLEEYYTNLEKSKSEVKNTKSIQLVPISTNR